MPQTKLMIIAFVIFVFIIIFLFGYCDFASAFSGSGASSGSLAENSGCQPIQINSCATISGS